MIVDTNYGIIQLIGDIYMCGNIKHEYGEMVP